MTIENCDDCGACCMKIERPTDIEVQVSDGNCPCLTTDRRCNDYENRPSICRDFPRGSDSCLAARERFGIPLPVLAVA